MVYLIGEFAEAIGIPTSTLRYYEKEGLIKPERDSNNIRLFTEMDRDWMTFLLHLKGTGMSMAELKQYTQWREQGDSTLRERLDLLKGRHAILVKEMAERAQNLNVMERKIAFYEDHLKGRQYAFVLHPEKGTPS